MMRLLVLMIGCLFAVGANASEVWQQFLDARENPEVAPVLPDFSYAGYERGEAGIPTVDYRKFDVTLYGAIPDDDVSDEEGIRTAIQAAQKHGEGVVFFPKGTYLVSTSGNRARHVFVIRKSRIVLRGEGSGPGGTVILMRDWLDGLTEGPCVGGWHDEFKHHRSARDDGGWSAVRIDNGVHSWIRDCVFEDCSRSICLWDCSFCSVLDIRIAGKNAGHHGLRAMGGYGVFCGNVIVTQPNHHAPCVGYGSSGTVLWHYRFSGQRGMDAHGNTGYATLLDCATGGVSPWSNGGAANVLPNHLRHLVWWNFRNTAPGGTALDFWKPGDRVRRPYYVMPIMVGLHGTLVAFKGDNAQLQLNESPGAPVKPESLFEAQLELRTGRVPDWLVELRPTKGRARTGTQ